MTAAAVIRPGRDDDAAGFIELIGGCWAEYPGCVMDLDGEVPELRALASHYAKRGGALWAAEMAGTVVGMVSTAPRPEAPRDLWEIGRMYVAKPQRGTGLAHLLLDRAEAHARAAGAGRLVLWTDTRFDAAHRFYEKRGFVRAGPIRILDDLSHSLEFRYARPLAGLVVDVLDAAGAASAEHSLAALVMETARGFWRRTATQVATGECVLLVAWLDGALAGTVTLDMATPPNQPHRAEVRTLLVHPALRRRGVARALMLRAEQAARHAGRSLLTLTTTAGDGADQLFRAMGWRQAGTIPGFTLTPDGTTQDAALFYRRLE